MIHIFYHINYVAVGVTSVIFFFIGSAWFSFLFRSQWIKELKHHNVTIREPKQSVLINKMILTFCANVAACIALACLVIMTDSTTVFSGLILGIITALGFAVPSLGSVFIWENRSLNLYLIDVGYPVVGIIVSAILLSLWH